ncbi:MAG: class I SAM-dependent methyltransferase [Parasphingorhabdus sp.]
MNASTLDGYVGDSLYPSSFHMAFSPPWVDAMLRRRRIKSPRVDRPDFTMADIGCGDGLGLILQAAAYPDSRFVGIDAMPEHIERGIAIITELGLTNIELRCQTFKQALESDPIKADYIAVQGVWSWVSQENQQALLALVSGSLNSGGVATLGYNSMPGWGPIAAFQKLIQSLSLDQPGTPNERFEAALKKARSASKVGMKALSTGQFDWFDDQRENLPKDYVAHEYLNQHWQPLWSGEAIDQANGYGLIFQCSSMANRLRDDFIFKAAQREQLTDIDNPAAREIMADLFLNCWFRTDIFSKGELASLSEQDSQSQRLATYWMAVGPKPEAALSVKTTAGVLRFDNAAAHHILDQLENGPASLNTILSADAPGTKADILNTIDSLFFAWLVRPVDPPQLSGAIEQINDWLAHIEANGTTMNAIVSPHGAISVKRGEISAALTDGAMRKRMGL